METLLHITDIHFGWDGRDDTGKADRATCLDGLIKALTELDEQWKPTIVCLSGDVGWMGKSSDYQEAQIWLQTLLDTCGRTWSDLVVCPGNHDIQRSVAESIARPSAPEEADRVLRPPLGSQYFQSFEEFTRFCETSGLPALQLGSESTRLVGFRSIRDIDFIVINSAWFSKDDQDQYKLWLGMPHLRIMEQSNSLGVIDYSKTSRLRIALVHHPIDWLNPNERQAAANRPSPWDYLAYRAHVILTGHTHGAVRPGDRVAEGAWHFTGGSAYAGASHFNSFRLIQLGEKGLVHRSFEFDPRDPSNKWHAKNAKALSWTPEPIPLQASDDTPPEADSMELQKLLVANAEKQIEQRSRLLRPSGELPRTIHRLVALRTSEQQTQFDQRRYFIRKENAEFTLSLYEALRMSRRTLLLGDLGTGKSTLAAGLVSETVRRSEQTIAAFVPVKELRLNGYFSPREALKAISDYVASNTPTLQTPPDFEALLRAQVEILVVLDGLDELDRDLAARLLKQAGALADTWPTIQLLATARPVEMVGVSYADWGIIHTVPLDDATKLQFLREELIADQVPSEEVASQAIALLERIKQKPSLNTAAVTPLALRLLYPSLKGLATAESFTLGDLLYQLLLERLDGWAKRDDKPNSFTYLAQIVPTPEQKLETLGVLARLGLELGSIPIEQAKAKIRDGSQVGTDVNLHLLADEFIQFFEWLGILTRNVDSIGFSLQPLAEMAGGVAIASAWKRGDTEALSRSAWRQVSFAATVARRRGDLQFLLSKFSGYLDELLADASLLPACCYIVAESKSSELAQTALGKFSALHYRPLTTFLDEREESAYNIAATFWLAGETGFEWFYRNYLDPRYPIPNAGSGVICDIFRSWGALAQGKLTPEQKSRLEAMVVPYKATGEGHFFGVLDVLAILIPSAFTSQELVWHYLTSLGNAALGPFANEAINDPAFVEADTSHFNNALLTASKENPYAAVLWLKRHPAEQVPSSIITLAFRAASRGEEFRLWNQLFEECKKRLGKETWERFARWLLSSPEAQAAAGAALQLFEEGERRLTVIGEGLFAGTHVWAPTTVAGELLKDLIKNAGPQGTRWIGKRIAQSSNWNGAWPESWRLLLSNAEGLKNDAPLLAQCVRKLGEITIPRHPEIREEFRRALSGESGSLLRNMLRTFLSDSDPKVRRGAAQILVSSFPKEEAEALFVAVRSRSHRSSEAHEWEDFCLSLEFSPAVLEFLRSKLPALDDQAKASAIILLRKNGFQQNEVTDLDLVRLLSQLGNWHLARSEPGKALLKDEPIFELLRKQLNEPLSEFRTFACEKLLEFHKERLTTTEKTKCLILTCSLRWGRWNLIGLMERIKSDSEFGQEVRKAGDELASRNERRPILAVIEIALRTGGEWNNVVWELLCDDTSTGGSGEADDTGQILLAFGLKHEEHRSAIGEAAKHWITDPRVMQNRWIDAFQWLALLANEFAQLPRETIEASLRRETQPIHCAAATALIARLGEVPSGVHFDRADRRTKIVQPTLANESLAMDGIFERLREFARDSQVPHPDLESTLERSLRFGILSEAQMSEIAAQGKMGSLVRVVLDFCYNRPISLEDTVSLLDIWMRLSHDPNATRSRLKHIWYLVRESLCLGEAQRDAEYLAILDREYASGDVWKPALAYEIFQVRGGLLANQIDQFLSDFAEHDTYLHELVLELCAKWLEREDSPEIKTALVTAARKALVPLNETAWRGDSVPNTCAYLLVPTIIWHLTQETSEDCEMVFLRALQQLVDRTRNTSWPQYPHAQGGHLSDLLKETAIVLKFIPQPILSSTLHRGLKIDEPVVRIFCHLVQAFALRPEATERQGHNS